MVEGARNTRGGDDMNPRQNTLTIRNAPVEIRRGLKVAAAEQGISMRELLIEIIANYLKSRKVEGRE